ncbi:MAG: glycoside hydrolase [Halobacteriales archaeon]|nr:glycoside hydrolase [Halobacteriales archaeon]
MRSWAAAAVLLLLLAGCTGSMGPPTGEPSGLQFQDVARTPGEQVAAEPNFAAGPGGLFLVAPGSLVSQPNVLDSQVSLWGSPDGAAWSALRTPSPRDPNGTFCSCDSDVDVGPDGTVYLTDFWVTSQANGFVVQVSGDGGHTWSRANLVPVERPRENDRQYIVAGRDAGEVYLAYARALGLPATPVPLPVDPVPFTDAGLHLLRSTDGGATFTPLPQVFHESATTFEFIAKPRVGPDGTLYFPWVEGPNADPWNGTATAVVAVSHDHGLTFSKRTIAPIPGGVGGLWPFELDVAGDGSLVAAWMERQPGAGSTLSFSSSTDQGATWTTPLKAAGGTALLPWISAAGPGRAVIAYYGSPNAVDPLHAPTGERWDAWAVVIDHGAAQPPVRVSPFPVKVGRFCPRGAACDADRELLDYPAVLWHDGWVHVAFSTSLQDPGAGPPPSPPPSQPEGAHATAGHLWTARARLP